MDRFVPTDIHGLPALRLASPDGATALVAHHGAHVLSWTPVGADERLYLSERAVYAQGTPIRGGIPVIFPQFGALGPLPRHGFARSMAWTLDDTRAGAEFTLATWHLDSDATTLASWPHAFHAELTVSIGGTQLDVELALDNTGTESFTFTTALHTYLRVNEIENASLTGLGGCSYRDQLAQGARRTESRDSVTFDGPVDRIYRDVPPRLVLGEPRRQLLIESLGFPDVVVWNPWDAGNAQIADMPPLGFRRMLCVEAATIETPVSLAPGDTWSGRQSLTAL
jgi:glucose-6-phosphate 1-epimerase